MIERFIANHPELDRFGNLTEWYPPSVRPTRAGLYLTRIRSEATQAFAVWDGRQWLIGQIFASDAAKSIRRSDYQVREWKGLAHDPAVARYIEVGELRDHPAAQGGPFKLFIRVEPGQGA